MHTADTSKIDPTKFWQWAFSDFMSNSLRGILAEYIVASAVGSTSINRTEWDAYDVLTEDGIKIEVKTSAYLQSWEQEKFSEIRFDIASKKAWDARSNTSSQEPLRSADIYVFCVFAAQDRKIANPLDLSQWFFIVCPTKTLDQQFPKQKTIGLSSLERIGLSRILFGELQQAIYSAVSSA